MAPKRMVSLQVFLLQNAKALGFARQAFEGPGRFLKKESVLEASVVSGSCVRLSSRGRAIGLAFVFALAAEHAADGCCPTGPLH